MKNKISVSDLIRHIFMSGDLTSEYFQNADMLDGIKAHQHIQSKYTEDDQKEVFIEHSFNDLEIPMILTGRIDGVLNETELILEEIKSTRENIHSPNFKYRKQHYAQLMLYAYMYSLNNQIDNIKTRLNYINIASYESKYFYFEKSIDELREFFIDSIDDYTKFQELISNHQKKAFASVKDLTFPFGNYRSGQRDLMKANFITNKQDGILYAIAPTGVGKTMAFLFSSLKGIEKSENVIFYLTAKNSGKTVAKKSLKILNQQGMECNCLELTAKEKICFKSEVKCDPEYCEYANGFFDRLQDATYEIIENETLFFSPIISEYAKKHIICPFEFSLYIGYFCEVIIGDYNYAFDPKIHLKRFFDDENYQPILLIDEAHNMIDRSVSMYSKEIELSTIKDLRRNIKSVKGKPVKVVKEIITSFKEASLLVEDEFHYFQEKDAEFIKKLSNLHKRIQELLTKNQSFIGRDEVINCYFKINDFLKIAEFYNESFITTIKKKDKDVEIKLNCFDASKFILKTIEDSCKSASFFSASFEPINYFKSLITSSNGVIVKIPSPFPKENLNLLVQTGISTKYLDRENSIDDIVETIYTLTHSKIGNYIVFFPSYKYMEMALDKIDDSIIKIVQKRKLNDLEKEEIISMFNHVKEKSQVGFFVLGGVFSEGIDLIGDMLNGVIVVGVGLPMFNKYNNLLKDYYQQKYSSGYDYAYTYKGFNKVIQAVGRLIRSEKDYGNVILIDERFTNYKYLPLVNMVWDHRKIIRSSEALKTEITTFKK